MGRQATSMLEADARANLWHGSVRSGKTVGSLLRTCDYVATSAPPGAGLISGKTERTIRRNVIDNLREMLGYSAVRVNWGKGEGYLLGRKFYIAGANDERSEDKIRGHTLAWGYGDELTLWPESFYRMFMSRLSVKGAKFFGTTNADAPLHWLKKNYIDRSAELDLKHFHFNIDDNRYLDPVFVAALKKEYTGLWYKRFIDGLWVLAEGVIWDMFDLDVHVVDKLPDGLYQYWLTIDYGTAAPFVALLLAHGRDKMTDREALYVVAEWRWDSKERKRQLTDAEYSSRLKKWLRTLNVSISGCFVDPSAVSFILQLNKDKFPRVQRADNAVDDGLRGVGTVLGARRLFIHRRCLEGLVAEIVGYMWDEAKQEKGEDAPVKVNDHGPDALRYGIRSLTRLWRPWVVTQNIEKAAGGIAA